MKRLFAAVFILCLPLAAKAQAAGWQPSAGHKQIAIWPGAPADAQAATKPESFGPVTDSLVAGMPWIYVADVSRPTMTIYSPRGTNTGAAVIVCPGGGFEVLAIDLEGTEICDWLTSRGITCVLLKYRVPDSGPHHDGKNLVPPKAPLALEDAQRALGLVRFNAAKYGIDPHKIGVIGFSAGGYLVADISTHYAKRAYAPVDRADAVSCRPDFAIAIYPGHLQGPGGGQDPNPDIHVTADTPPTFLLQAEDDHVDSVNDALDYYIVLKNAGVPAELHLYPHGGHAFGLRRSGQPITQWPDLVVRWLQSLAMIPGPPGR